MLTKKMEKNVPGASVLPDSASQPVVLKEASVSLMTQNMGEVMH